MKHGRIVFRTEIPNHEDHYKVVNHDWLKSIYGVPEEETPNWMPPWNGKAVRLTTFKDANLLHCKVTGKACTGVLPLAEPNSYRMVL